MRKRNETVNATTCERVKKAKQNQINENHSVYYVIKINVPFFHNNCTRAYRFNRTFPHWY